MRIYLGEEFEPGTNSKIFFIKSNFKKDQYKIIETGFLINEYFVEFVDNKYATLYYMQYPI